MLKSGYYWVLIDDPDGGEPEIAHWDDSSWDRCGSDISVNAFYAPRLEVLAAIPPFVASTATLTPKEQQEKDSRAARLGFESQGK